MGWLVDPSEQVVLAYLPHSPPVYCEQVSDILPAPAFAKDLKLTVGDLFGWIKVG
ncbi:MAG: hypothetical protein AAFN18_22585 [Cyanobacteria bacterium J06554_6]